MSQATLESRVESLEKTILAIQNSIKSKQPTQPEGYQGLNKWYVTGLGSVYYITADGDCLGGYGLSHTAYWEISNRLTLKGNIKRLATESEIKEAILKGCEQNGIVEGATIKASDGTNHDLIKPVGWQFDQSTNIMWVSTKIGWLLKVFDNGKFVEVVKEEKSDKHKQWQNAIELEQEALSNIFEKPTDKELLKDCADAFELYLDDGILLYHQAQELLKRINEVIKPKHKEMTHKEEAINRVEEFEPHAKNWDCYNDEPLDENNAKQCALLAIDREIKLLELFASTQVHYKLLERLEKVKQEIENL